MPFKTATTTMNGVYFTEPLGSVVTGLNAKGLHPADSQMHTQYRPIASI